MSYQVAALQDRGGVPNYEASMVKLFSSELGQRLARTSVNLYKLSGQLLAGSKGYEVSDGRIAHSLSRSLPSTIAGGSSEAQRGIIATRGLGLSEGPFRHGMEPWVRPSPYPRVCIPTNASSSC